MIDFRWQPEFGGIFLDSTGDIAVTDASTLDSIRDIVLTRLKAATDGWKLYSIGAALESRIGDILSPEFQLSLQRQVVDALPQRFLPANALQVKVLTYQNQAQILVYLQSTLLVNATLNDAGVSFS